jgi:hypothetical protein
MHASQGFLSLSLKPSLWMGKGKTIAGVPSQFYHRVYIIAVLSSQLYHRRFKHGNKAFFISQLKT